MRRKHKRTTTLPGGRMHISPRIFTVVFIFLVLLIPNRISQLTPSTIASFPLEPVLFGLLLLIPGRVGILSRILASIVLALGVIIKIADIGAYQVFGRAFNPVLDARWPADGLNLLQGALGHIGALIVVIFLVSLIIVIVQQTYIALGTVQMLMQMSPKVCSLGLTAALSLWMVLAAAGWQKATVPLYQLMSTHVHNTLTSMDDLNAFSDVVDSDPYAAVSDSSLFTRLKGKDVLVVFIESYGRTVLDKPAYASHIRPVLEQSNAKLAAKRLFARSAYLTSPTYGGISWLAHGTLLSGLWVNSQVRYDRLVMGDRPTLNRLFQRAGWRTVAVQPAHTMDWPQGKYFGYDRIYAAQDLGYQGVPFNWITMPDQYTLSAFQSLERKQGMRLPVMAEIALISSHAPWTPLPQMVEWDQVGDGAIFKQQARSGDAPEVVWRKTERIREQYRKSIEYALANIVSYATTYGGDNLVILVLGDHQPAPFVTEDAESHEVPVHIISSDPKVMESIQDWQWTEGMIPATNAPIWGMDKMRDRFIQAFSQ